MAPGIVSYDIKPLETERQEPREITPSAIFLSLLPVGRLYERGQSGEVSRNICGKARALLEVTP